jgi:hypothetical protein
MSGARFGIVIAVGIILSLSARPADAQTEQSFWGVAASWTPKWKAPTGDGVLAKMAEISFTEGDSGLDVRGFDFRIGIVRGRSQSGEWGVSYFRKTLKTGSTQGSLEQICEPTFVGTQQFTDCYLVGTQYTYDDVWMDGVEMNKFVPFVTIKKRVQIGMDFAGGVGWMKGTAQKTEGDPIFQDVRNAQGQSIGYRIVSHTTTTAVDPKELMVFDPMLIGRVELAAAGIITPQIKIRASGGISYPGISTISVTGSYLFGKP